MFKHVLLFLSVGAMLIISQPAEKTKSEKKGAYEVTLCSITKVWRQMRDEGKINTVSPIDLKFRSTSNFIVKLHSMPNLSMKT